MIVARAGDDLRTLQQELDKLLLYAADRPAIQPQDVEAVVADHGEGWIFDLTRAIGDRDALGALGQLSRLMGQGEHPLKILGTIAGEVRRLLAARQLLDGDLRPHWKRGISYQQFQQIAAKHGSAALTRNPYADYMCFQRAERFAMAELVGHMESLFDADLRLEVERRPTAVGDGKAHSRHVSGRHGAISRKATLPRGHDHASPARSAVHLLVDSSVIVRR